MMANRGLFDLTGRCALVVGGSRGLGRAMALYLAQAGADVAVVGRNRGQIEDAAHELQTLGRRSHAIIADVTEWAQVQAMARQVMDSWGRIDILVNSAGTVSLAPTIEFPVEEWERIIRVNLEGTFLCCKAVAPVMIRQRKGKIINVSSVRGFQGRAQDPAYAASKGAVHQLTRSLAIEWATHGINVNAIAPVFTPTEMGNSVLEDPETRSWVLSRIPMKRLGHPDDLHGPVVFLASDASDFVTGHVLVVDGGWTAA